MDRAPASSPSEHQPPSGDGEEGARVFGPGAVECAGPDASDLEDARLLGRVNDPVMRRAALEALWEKHRRWVAAVLLVYKPREADLEDLLQDVALMMVAKIQDVRGAGGDGGTEGTGAPNAAASFKPWLRAVAISIARTRGRRVQTRRAGLRRLWSWAGPEREGGAVGDRMRDGALEQGRGLLELASELPDAYREPLILKSLHDMSYREIGRVMGLPETTIETRIARGRRMLRELAEARASEGPGGAMRAAGAARAGAPAGIGEGVSA